MLRPSAWLRAARDHLSSRWRPVRMVLTALYTAFFLVMGVGLLAIMSELVVHSSSRAAARPVYASAVHASAAGGGGAQAIHPALHALPRQAAPGADVHQLLVNALIALAIMTALAVGVAWIMAGRILQPIRTMTSRTRQISASNLHQRLALGGPNDEVKDLADTFDDLLERLETAFSAQRRFIANAAHELTTPLTLERALLEVALADPDASLPSLRAACGEVLAANQGQERLIEALLALATSERGLDRRDAVDLAALAGHVLARRRAEVARSGLRLEAQLAPSCAHGSQDLLERLVENLVDNALHHNEPGGWLEVHTAQAARQAALVVRNGGPLVPREAVARLLQPFQRLGGERIGTHGHGLGLSIVQAVVRAHDGRLTVEARPGGGLDVKVTLPAPPGAAAP